MEWLSLLGVFVALAVFIFLAYKGYNIIFLSILASIIVAAFSAQNPITALTGTFSGAFSGFIKTW